METDCDIDSYTIDEIRVHIRIAGCTDTKLKEELLKLGQQDSEEPLTRESIFTVTRNYEQRMTCLRSETEDVSVSAVITEANRRGNCRACAKETGFNRASQTLSLIHI